MNDDQIHFSIEQLVAEEHDLWQREGDGTATDADRAPEGDRRLAKRRAQRNAGLDPDAAAERTAGVVENYER